MAKFNVHEWNYKRRLASLNESNLQEGNVMFSTKETGLPYNLDFSEVPAMKSGIKVIYDAITKLFGGPTMAGGPDMSKVRNPTTDQARQFDFLVKAAMGYTGGTAGVDKFIDPRIQRVLDRKIGELADSKREGKIDGKMFRELIVKNIERFASHG